MHRDAHVRAARKRQALDALAFEREREALLAEQLEDVLAEADGAALDASVFARMDEADAALVRTALGDVEVPFDPDEADEDDLGDEEDPGDFAGEEAARLEDEIASSRRIQAALSRYLELLDEPASAGDAG